MYSGLLPEGLTEDDLSPDDEDDEQEGEAAQRMMREGEKCGSSAAKLNSTGGNTRTNSAASEADSEYPTCSMPGISQEMWQVCQVDTQQARLSELRERCTAHIDLSVSERNIYIYIFFQKKCDR